MVDRIDGPLEPPFERAIVFLRLGFDHMAEVRRDKP